MIASNVGLRHMSARAGVTVSVPSAAVLFWLALPAFIDPALAAVTLLVFESNARLGPTPGGHPNSPTRGHPKLPHLSTDSRG